MSKPELIQKVQKWIDANGCTCNPQCLTEVAEQIVRECARIAMEASWSHGNEVKHEILITFGLKE